MKLGILNQHYVQENFWNALFKRCTAAETTFVRFCTMLMF